MPRVKLTKRAVDGVAIGQKRGHFWDEDVAGFGLRVTPTGERIICSSIASMAAQDGIESVATDRRGRRISRARKR